MKDPILIGVILLLTFGSVKAQEGDVVTSNRVWYSFYLHKKINHRWSVDNYSLIAMRSFNHNFWLAQVSIGANYRINRFWTLSFGYGHSLYKYSAWWEEHYDFEPSFMNTVSFHNLTLAIKRRDNLGKRFRLSNRFIVQYYVPRFEKYQFRFQYVARVDYRRNNLPLRMRPFVQGALYYYLNGIPLDYFDEDLEEIDYGSPNGLHRFRVRAGLSFAPFAKNTKFRITLYYAHNREFNIGWSGRDLNAPQPADDGDNTEIAYPFNTYNIFGVQLNYFF